MALDNLALPYSEENQRLLRTLEQGRIPWDVLRRHPDLQAAAEGKYHDGSLVVEVTDLRAPEHEAAIDDMALDDMAVPAKLVGDGATERFSSAMTPKGTAEVPTEAAARDIEVSGYIGV